tara:strand:+ start:41703 stop:42770 length:1068 start_codon:yes stop_codon:yes gene_type:complete
MRLKLKGVYANTKTLSDGTKRTYYSLRGVGAIRPEPGDEDAAFHPGTPAFMRAYNKLIEAPRQARVSGTLQSIIDGYQKSPQFTKLAPRTQKDYIEHIVKIERAKFKPNLPLLPTYPLDVIDDPKIRKRFLDWRDEMARSSPRQADATLGVLRIILEWGRDRGMIANNHATRPKKVYKADRSDKLWLPDHIAAFRAVAPPEILLALDLALWTGQRQGDLLKLGWSSYKDGRLTFRQGKRKRKVDMPAPAALKAVLDAAPRKAATILTSKTGKPWGKVNFQHKWRAATLAAELDGLHFHDIRGTTCTMLADAGCTPSEIAAVLGWTVSTVNEMLDRYQSMTATQSNSAIRKLEARA